MGLSAQVLGIKEDKAVEKWLAYCSGEHSRKTHISIFHGWIRWLQDNGFKGITPSDLIRMQKSASGDDQYRLLDLLQEYIRQRGGTYNYNQTSYSILRSFFIRNRTQLPEDKFKIPHNREPVRAKLSLEHIRILSLRSDYGRAAFYLTLWQSLMDQEGFQYFNKNYGKALSDHLKTKGTEEPFMIEFPGRKNLKGRYQFFTFIGRDALTSWLNYFERERDHPVEGEFILLDRDKKPASKESLKTYHIRLLERMRWIKRGGGSSHKRYGFNLHEFRDIAKTVLHLEGRKEGLDMNAVDFWMGHVVDSNNYDKFYMDKKYMLEQYRIAEKHLNIISGIKQPDIKNVEKLVEQIIKNSAAFGKLQDALHENGFIIDLTEERRKTIEKLNRVD